MSGDRLYRQASLYRRTLGSGDGSDTAVRRLEAAYENLREKVGVFVSQIPKDIPELTVHDLSHLEALWSIADLIAGEDYPLNPMEGFLLGASFLLHDLGMALASYEGGLEELQATAEWQEIRQKNIRLHGLRLAADEDLPEPIRGRAIAETLRKRHAQQASRMATSIWFDSAGNALSLFDDAGLRDVFALLIGKIAQSHGWPINRLTKELGTKRGAPAGYPPTWTVDPVKIACLLRVADAGHLDAARAPKFSRAVLQPSGHSDVHWLFQGKINQPFVDPEDTLNFTSSAFTKDEIPAWWEAHRAIVTLDREIKDTNALLIDTNTSGTPRPPFAVKRVRGAESPSVLAEKLLVSGWTPIDTSIKINDPVKFVSDFGGARLYGDRPDVVLRELIQNAVDAINARKALEPAWAEANPGRIRILLESVPEGWKLRIQDNGVGMSAGTMTGGLIKFGESFWQTEAANEELPDLARSSFKPIGKFGIGFFSVFMISNRVSVTSTSRINGKTHRLSFSSGLSLPAVLEELDRQEGDYVTEIAILIKKGTLNRLTTDPDVCTFSTYMIQGADLTQLVCHIAPATNIDLEVIEPAGRFEIPHDFWLRAPSSLFAALVDCSRKNDTWLVLEGIFANPAVWRSTVENNPAMPSAHTIIHDDENRAPIGRVTLQYDENSAFGYHVVQGIRGGREMGMAGFLPGDTDVLSRGDTYSTLTNITYHEILADQMRRMEGKRKVILTASLDMMIRLRVDVDRAPTFLNGERVVNLQEMIDTLSTDRIAVLDISKIRFNPYRKGDCDAEFEKFRMRKMKGSLFFGVGLLGYLRSFFLELDGRSSTTLYLENLNKTTYAQSPSSSLFFSKLIERGASAIDYGEYRRGVGGGIWVEIK